LPSGSRTRSPVLLETKVENLYPARRQHDIARLEIAMDDAGTMCGVEGFGDLDTVQNRLLRRQPSAFQPVREGLAFQKLHHQELDPVLVADVEQRTDVRMR